MAPGKTVRELPKLPVVRPTPARGVARGGGKGSGLFLTCRRSFHLAAPKGAESAGPGAGPPLAEPSPEEPSALLASASVTPDSIPLEPLLHELPPPQVSPARTCLFLPCQDLSSRASLPLPSPKSAFPVFSSPWQPGQRCLRHCTILRVATLSEGGPEGEELWQTLPLFSLFAPASSRAQNTSKESNGFYFCGLKNPGGGREGGIHS